MKPVLLDLDTLPVNMAVYKKEYDDFIFVEFNLSAERTEGVDRKKLLGCKLTEVFPEVKEVGLYDVLLRVYNSGQSEVHNNIFYRDNKLSGWRKNYIIKLPDGTVAAIYKNISLDKVSETLEYELEDELSEIKESIYYQRALEKSEEKFNDFEEISKDWLWEINKHGVYTYSSPIVENLLDYTSAEIIGKSPFDLMTTEEANRVSGIFNKYKEKKSAFNNLENINIHKNGSQVIFLTSGVPIIDECGELIGYRGLDRDITLEKKIVRDIQIEKEEAEHANAAKSEFLSSMSHELRTPMNAILGFSQLLGMNIEKNLTDIQLENIKQIGDAGNHLLNLINEILDLSKIESGQFMLSKDVIILSHAMKEALHLIIPLAEQKGLSLKLINNGKVIKEGVECQQVLLTVDYTRFKQVIINLLSNAVKYNNQNGSIIISCDQYEGKLLRIQITDTGNGLNKEQLTQLFKPFERLGAESDSIEGTGIGLVITKKLVKLMGGRIGVESTPGKGSTFWLEFPCNEAGDLPMTKCANKEKIQEILVAEYEKKYTILYVEDNPANLHLVKQTLATKSNLILLDAFEALLGIELAILHQPDLILMDINLPGISGLEALKKLQQNKNTSHIPVIAVTAKAMHEDVENGLEEGFKEYITKPINVIKLLETIERNLDLSTSGN